MISEDHMELTPVGEPIIVGENGHFLVSDGEIMWKVIVTPEALAALTKNPGTPIADVGVHMERLARIAEGNPTRMNSKFADTLWIMKTDVEAWTASRRRWRPRGHSSLGHTDRTALRPQT